MHDSDKPVPIHPLLATDPSLDPIEAIAQICEQDPVHWIPGLDAWFVSRHDDVRQLFADAPVSADPRDYERYRPPTHPGAARWLSELPFRSRTEGRGDQGRRLVAAAFTPRSIARIEHRVDEVVEEYAAPLRGRRGHVDLVGEFTKPVAATVIGRLLGVPPLGEDERRFRQLAVRATRGINPILSDKQRGKAESASVEISEYVLGLVVERRVAPRDDLISDLVRAAESDVDASDEDITRVVSALVAAGTGTTSLAATRALRSLLEHPDQLALLRREPELLPNAIQELLRFHSGLLVMPRYVIEDFELRGKPLCKGQLVVLSQLSANRDPRVFDDPNRLDLRRDTRESLSFGYGVHYCPGANLARAELQSILAAALEFLPPDARVVVDEIRWSARGIMSQIRALPVDFGT